MSNPPLIQARAAYVVPIDEARGPLSSIDDVALRDEIGKLWTTFESRFGYDGKKADHTFATQADLKALHLSLMERLDKLPVPKTYDDMVNARAR